MTFDEFQTQTMEAVKRAFPSLTVEKQEVSKLQGESYTGMAVKPKQSNIAATVNLKLFYDRVEAGDMSAAAAIRNVIDNISEITRNMPQIDVGMLTDYQQMKEKLTLQLIPVSGNEEKLAGIPHKAVDELAVVYRFELENNRDGSASVLITNDLLKSLGIDAERLHADALETAQRTHPATLRNMNDVMLDMMGDAASLLIPDEPSPMWVASIEGGQLGACAIQYPGFMDQAAETLGGDFFILPSSIHEVLFVPDNGEFSLPQLAEMVRNVNENEVSPADKLSDTVFHYDSKEHVFENAWDFASREAEMSEILMDEAAPGLDAASEKITVLLVEPGKYPKPVEVGTELEDLQQAVGGYIEVTYPFEEEVGIIVNEEGKLSGLPLNRAIRDESGEIMDVVAGSFLVVGLTEESFGSLRPDQMENYKKMFHQPQTFLKMGRSIMAIPLPDTEVKKEEKAPEKAVTPKTKKPVHEGH